MHIAQFFSKVDDAVFFHTQAVICFKGNQEAYPLLFFSLLFKRLKTMPIISIDCVSEQWPTIQAQLETSFLGQRYIYWLGNISELDEKKKKQLIVYLGHYTGPNCVALFLPAELSIANKQCEEIMVEPLIDQTSFIKLLTFFEKNGSVNIQSIVTRVYKENKTIPLDTACLLMHYLELLSANTTDYFISDWLSKIVTPEKSLFTLSAYLFSKKAKLFLQEWSKIGPDYSEQFWVAFWSEQLWRAYHFVEYSRAHQPALAKRIAMRLPFTFMQRDWQNFSVNELRNAHQAIYEIDFALKNGGSAIALDAFYSKFFLGQFSQ